MLTFIGLIFFLFFWGAMWIFLDKFVWKNIKGSASIYKTHFNIEVDPFRKVRFKNKRRTPRDLQSYSYKRIQRQVDMLEESFAIAFTACVIVLSKALLPPYTGIWNITGIAVIYILLFFLILFWGTMWIPKLINTLLHFPQDRLPYDFDDEKFKSLLKTDIIIGVLWGIIFNFLEVDSRDRGALMFFSLSFAGTIPFCRFFPRFLLEKYSSVWDLLAGHYDPSYHQKMNVLQASLIEAIETHPSFRAWMNSVPQEVSRLVEGILKKKQGIEFLAEADKTSPEDLEKYRFIETLLCGNPEIMTETIVRVLDEMKDAVKAYSPKIEVLSRPA